MQRPVLPASCPPRLTRREGIARSFEKLIERHGSRVLRLLSDVLAHSQDAEDAWQETWYAIWRARKRLRPRRDPWPFIRTTAVRKALDRMRGRRATTTQLAGEPAAPSAAGEHQTLDALGHLPPRERTVLVLFFWEGLSVAEIAAVLDVPSGTIKTWMHRGRARLRRRMLQQRET